MGFIPDVLTSFVAIMPVTLAQSLILAFVVLGIMIPFRMLNFPDLTSEGAFPLGGCVCGVLLAAGVSPLTCWVALPAPAVSPQHQSAGGRWLGRQDRR